VSQFEYVMVLLSIVLGLGITHLLVGIGGLLYRISAQGKPVRLYWGHLLWVAFVFIYLIGFWWWEFSWAGTETWGLLLYVFLVLYATSLFLLCVVLFPRRADDVADFGTYFLAVRKWFYGLLLAVTGIDVAEAFLKGPEYLERLGAMYWILTFTILVIAVIGISRSGRRLHGSLAAVALVFELVQLLATYPLLS
jgi:hypothetical protein